MSRVTGMRTIDVRFPTSTALDGSDAMNPDPDYSAAYVILETDDGQDGHGLTFTIGRGNELARAAIDTLAPLIIGRGVDDPADELAGAVELRAHRVAVAGVADPQRTATRGPTAAAP